MGHVIFVAGSQLGTNERLCFLAIVHCAHDSYGSLRFLRSKFLQSTLKNSESGICECEDGECVHCEDEDGEGYIVRVWMVCVYIVKVRIVRGTL